MPFSEIVDAAEILRYYLRSFPGGGFHLCFRAQVFHCLDGGQPATYVITMIGRQVRLLLLAKEMRAQRVTPREMGQRLKLRGFAVGRAFAPRGQAALRTPGANAPTACGHRSGHEDNGRGRATGAGAADRGDVAGVEGKRQLVAQTFLALFIIPGAIRRGVGSPGEA